MNSRKRDSNLMGIPISTPMSEHGATPQRSGNEIALYGLLIDQLQKYTAILWQFPTALVAANAFAVDKFWDKPALIVALAVINTAFAYAFHRLVRRQTAIIDATKRAESSLMVTPDKAFVPHFEQGGVSAPQVLRAVLWLVPIALLVLAFKNWRPDMSTLWSWLPQELIGAFTAAVLLWLLWFIWIRWRIGQNYCGEWHAFEFKDGRREPMKNKPHTKIKKHLTWKPATWVQTIFHPTTLFYEGSFDENGGEEGTRQVKMKGEVSVDAALPSRAIVSMRRDNGHEYAVHEYFVMGNGDIFVVPNNSTAYDPHVLARST